MARPADPNARAALRTAARAEFARRGIKGARIEDITSACGLSKGAYYLHYESKEALFRELVHELIGALETHARDRADRMKAYVKAHGALKRADMLPGAHAYDDYLALETACDLQLLELLWSYRDVVRTLLRGSQGTEFESIAWDMIRQQKERIVSDFRELQRGKKVRTDIPPEVFGTMVVGTYFLLGQQFSETEKKPDLERLASSLHRLLHEGASSHSPDLP